LWINNQRGEFTYDEQYKQLSATFLRWMDDTWVNERRSEFEYDDNGNRTLELRYTWEETAWVFDRQTTFEYNEANLQTLYLIENKMNGEFQNTERGITEYDEANQAILFLIQRWEAEWQNYRRVLFDYDDAGNRILTYNQGWEDNAWQDERRRIRAYTAGGRITKILDEFGVDGNLVNASRRQFYYDTFTSTQQIQQAPFEVQLFPNPTSDYLNIHFGDTNFMEKQVLIYDALGKLVEQQGVTNGSSAVIIDLSQLTKGQYFVQIRIRHETLVKKLQILD